MDFEKGGVYLAFTLHGILEISTISQKKGGTNE